tara:strand:- start:3118 stop:3522 length:405 start_codon:yes stop_codon:yes gene_type:complete
MKVCTGIGHGVCLHKDGPNLPLTEFYSLGGKRKGQYQARCKKCHLHVIKQTSTYNPEYQKARAEKSRGSWRTLPEGTTKTCSGINGECHHEEGPELPANDKFFGNKARGKYGLNARCKVCQKIENSRRKSAKKE